MTNSEFFPPRFLLLKTTHGLGLGVARPFRPYLFGDSSAMPHISDCLGGASLDSIADMLTLLDFFALYWRWLRMANVLLLVIMYCAKADLRLRRRLVRRQIGGLPYFCGFKGAFSVD